MRHSVELSDEVYDILVRLAQERGQTPQALIEAWVTELKQAGRTSPRDPRTEPRYYTTEEWFRHLGISDERIQHIKDKAAHDTDAGDADAR